MKSRLFSVLLVLCMVLTMLPTTAFADTVVTLDPIYVSEPNPLYPKSEDSSDIVYYKAPTFLANPTYKGDEYFEDLADAAQVLRAGMEQRQSTISIKVFLDSDDFDGTIASRNALTRGVYDAAIAHTGVGTQGDYLHWVVSELTRGSGGSIVNGDYYLTLTYNISYYTTAVQEQAVTERLAQIIPSFGFTAETDDYTKIKTIYDYICAHVTYDHTNLNDDSYKLKYTAYAALINGTSVCEGYAVLLYRMLLDAGVDTRVVTGISFGENHGWNIAKLGNVYYDLDSTWDAGETNYDYFLKCPATFDDTHAKAAEYTTPEFLAAYPMATTDYSPPLSGKCGSSVNWSLNGEGVLSLTGSGAMHSYDAGTPWNVHSSKIKSVTVAAGITSICSDAFADCINLTEIIFAGAAPAFGEDCFAGVKATAYYPCNDASWSADKLQDYGGELTWKTRHGQQATITGKAATCTATGLTDGKKCSVCGTVTAKQQTIAKTAHKETTVTGKAATCTATGLTDGKKCSVCGTVTAKQQTIAKTAHKETTVTGKAATCTATGLTDGKKCTVCGTVTVKQQTIAKAAHNYQYGICTVCQYNDPDYTPVKGVGRVYGASRYETAFKSADSLKKVMGVEKFAAAVVTSGDNFADALAGSYLAYVKNAPILLTDNDNIKDVMAYIQENVASGATIYALGGKAVVTDKLLELEKKGYDVKRLAGKSRFETNLEILKECGSIAGKDILVCTGFNFADSLSASAAKRPILLVDDKLTSEQKAYLKQQRGCKYYMVGGTGAVTSSVEKSPKDYGTVKRLAGANRFETSVMVAETFFSKPTTAVLAYGYNFPDGLCAGPLAAIINAPLILTATGDEAQAAAYAKDKGIKDGLVLGGPALISNKSAVKIFSIG